MMKLHRPLCSDVTLRLTADLSPDEDDVEDVMTSINKLNEGNNSTSSSCSCCLDNKVDNNSDTKTTCLYRNYTRQYSDQNDNHYAVANRHTHYRRNRTNSLNHNHNCTWYSRQNTDDKTAKDIYNQEHLLLHNNGMNTSSDFKKVTLDSEFKRSFEEDGNDFKETSIFQELTENGFPENQQSPIRRGMGNNNNHNKQKVLSRLETMYSDAKLSCLKDTARFSSKYKLNGVDLDDEYNDNDDIEENDDDDDEIETGSSDDNNGFTRKRRRHASGDTDATNTTFDDYDEEMTKKETDEDIDEEDEETHQGMDTDFSDDFDEDIPPSRLSDLPVDLDEDVDVVDKQLMSDSMIESFYGEVDESLLQTSMCKSIHEEAEPIPDEMSKSIAEEIHEVILGGDTDVSKESHSSASRGSDTRLTKQLPFPYPFTLKHAGHLFDKCGRNFARTAASSKPKSRSSRERTLSSTSRSINDDTTTTSSTATTTPTSESSTATDTISQSSDINSASKRTSTSSLTQIQTKSECSESKREVTQHNGRQRCSVSTMTMVSSLDLEVTHRGLHRFVPRHKDEINIGIGDPIHVLKECDDLWCHGINLRTGEKGIFPAVYANDLTFLEESDDDEEYWRFSMRFLGSVEVTSHKGDETLVHAINKVAMSHKGNVRAAACSSLEISQYGIRMIDKSKEGHEKDAFSHFFALKNISFCGTHPKNNRYFAFITKHPRQYRFACHVFYGDRPTHRARDALGEAFKRFYQEYMAFTHPTEDIYME